MLKPKKYIASLKRSGFQLAKKNFIRVHHKSIADNIYHCCVQKTASQWIKAILNDHRVYKYSGLITYDYEGTRPEGHDARKLTEKTISIVMPHKVIVTPLYLDFTSFGTIPKPNKYRAFFVARDPRDIIVSWYFSAKISHTVMGSVGEIRTKLNEMDIEDGLKYSIRNLEEYGLFQAMQSWIDASKIDPNVLMVKFEKLTASDQLFFFRELFAHLDIRMPENILKDLLADHSFKKKTRGREQGQEDQASHFRKGISGDWRNYFNNRVEKYFNDITGNLLAQLKYE